MTFVSMTLSDQYQPRRTLARRPVGSGQNTYLFVLRGEEGCAGGSGDRFRCVGNGIKHSTCFAVVNLGGAVLQPALDVVGTALLGVRAGHLREAVRPDDRAEPGLLLDTDGALGRESKTEASFATLGVARLGMADGVTDRDDFVKAAQRISSYQTGVRTRQELRKNSPRTACSGSCARERAAALAC